MVHYFKLAGQRFVLDEASGYRSAVDEMTYKMFVYLTLPLPETCPSSIRYDMAKYDSQLVEKTYQSILALHKAGKLYTSAALDIQSRPQKLLYLSSCDDPSCMHPMEDGFTLYLTDTDRPDRVRILLAEAACRHARVIIRVTDHAVYPADVLLYPEEEYAQHRNDAEQVGVWFAYDAAKPGLLSHVTALADDGVTLIDAVPENEEALLAGEQNALIKEFGKTAKELYLRIREKRPVIFVPFAVQTEGFRAVRGTAAAFSAPRCQNCPHRMLCGGDYRSDALCELKEACTDANILLTLCK